MRPLVHAAAAVFAVAVTAYALLGAAAGLARPTFSLDPEGVAAGVGAPFGFWITLVGLVCVTAAVSALAAYRLFPRARGIAMLLWTVVVAVVGTRVFAATGDLTAYWLADPPARLPVSVTAGTVTFVAAAFCAAIFYWCAGLVDLEPEPESPKRPEDSKSPDTPEGDAAAVDADAAAGGSATAAKAGTTATAGTTARRES
ncbi:hypothetical protein [Corynebacterium frankenforstense]|uniref:hypothetical protein n=1 Tax=Corynebacterium frankenforstense TaxID=1230998 RepID=UPI0026F10FB0|nr:hypothetical protein [Corynebacterium frankenforstense]